jgi:hypothetical protein
MTQLKGKLLTTSYNVCIQIVKHLQQEAFSCQMFYLFKYIYINVNALK